MHRSVPKSIVKSMAFKLQTYLKRTGQTLASWASSKGITNINEMQDVCVRMGLSPSDDDVRMLAELFTPPAALDVPEMDVLRPKSIAHIVKSVVLDVQAPETSVATKKRRNKHPNNDDMSDATPDAVK